MALPGVKTTILDRFYNLGRTDLPSGPLLALIAKRDPGTNTNLYPDLAPFFAAGEQDVMEAYGAGSNCHRAYYEASLSGAGSIVLIPLPADTVFNNSAGTLASATYTTGGGTTPLFQAAMDAVQSVRADVVVPWGSGADPLLYDDYATPATPGYPGGWVDGKDYNDFFFADNSPVAGNSWAKQTADRCAAITLDSHPILGVIGIKGFIGAEVPSPQQVATGLALPLLINKESVPNGHFVNVVAGEFRPIAYPSSWGWASAAVSYAASITRYDAWRALTGKPVYNVDMNRYNPTRSQAEGLAAKGVVTSAQNSRNALQWVDACTFALNNSDFARLSTLRICFDATKQVISVGENYIGEAMSTAKQNSFSTELNSRLQSMQRIGALINSDFRVTYDGAANKAKVDLALWPAFELREIILEIMVNF